MRILSFDIESCTGNPYDGSLCSFGYVFSENGAVKDSADILCNPLPARFTLGKWGQEPTLKLAYPVSTFRKQPRFSEIYLKIKKLFEEADFAIGFSVSNDLKYLNNACDKFGLPRINYKFLDVQLLAGLVFPEVKNLGLKTVAEKFEKEFLAHRSDEDARVTLNVFENVVKAYGKPLESLLEDFGIVYGTNGQEGHVNCYSLYAIKERLDTQSKGVKKLLFDCFKRVAKKNVTQKSQTLFPYRVGVSEKIVTSDTDTVEKIVAAVYACGGKFADRNNPCNLMIAEENDKSVRYLNRANTGEVKFVTPQKFLIEYGGDFHPFDKMQALLLHYGELVSDREEDKTVKLK